MTILQDQLHDNYRNLLMRYAAGNLDSAQNLIVSAHLQISSSGQTQMGIIDSIGGCLLENQCIPEAMSENSLDNVLKNIDSMVTGNNPIIKTHGNDYEESLFPDNLLNIINNNQSDIRWNNVYPGFKSHDIDLNCKSSSSRLMKAEPGAKSPDHSHKGLEITLILDGALIDGDHAFKRGDLIVVDDQIHHEPSACPDHGCTCMVVASAPIKLRGFASLLNPFLKK